MNGAEPVGNDNARTVKPGQRVCDRFLRDVVKRGSGLVENEDRRLLRNNPRNEQTLFLPPGDGGGVIRENRLHTEGHGPDIIRNPCRFRGGPRLLFGQVRP